MKRNRITQGFLVLSLSLGLSSCSESDFLSLFDELAQPKIDVRASSDSNDNPTLGEVPMGGEKGDLPLVGEPISTVIENPWEYVTLSKSFERYFFLNSQTLWGGTRNYQFLSGGSISSSGDQGKNWTLQTKEGLANIHKIQFLNAENGWAIGSAEGFGIAMYLGHTQSGGKQWTQLNDFFLASKKAAGYSAVNSPIYLMSPIDENQNFIADSSTIWRTSNRGEAWSEVSIPDYNRSLEKDGSISNLMFFDSGEGKVFSQNGLFITQNKGNTWERVNKPWTAPTGYPTFDTLLLSYFRDSKQGYTAVRWKNEAENTLLTVLYRSDDGGRSWAQVYASQNTDSPDPAHPALKFDAIYFLNENEGWMGGDGDFIAHTQDGGSSWKVTNNTGKNRSITGFYPSLGEAKILASTNSSGYWELTIN